MLSPKCEYSEKDREATPRIDLRSTKFIPFLSCDWRNGGRELEFTQNFAVQSYCTSSFTEVMSPLFYSLQRICKLVAICLHYFFCTSFSWMFVEGLHMYRRLREKRNIDSGKMSFYYFMGWGKYFLKSRKFNLASGKKNLQKSTNQTACSPFLDSREGARNSRAKKPKTGAGKRRWAGEAPFPQSLLFFYSSPQSLHYPERDCEQFK